MSNGTNKKWSNPRELHLTTIGKSKLAKRTAQPEMHGKVPKPGFQPAGKCSADKNASRHPSPTSIIWNFSWFSKFPAHVTGWLVPYNCLVRNAQPWYFKKWNSNTRGHNDLQKFSEYTIYGHEKHGENSKAPGLNDHNSLNKCPWRRYYSSVQPPYESWKVKRRRAARHWNRASERISCI